LATKEQSPACTDHFVVLMRCNNQHRRNIFESDWGRNHVAAKELGLHDSIRHIDVGQFSPIQGKQGKEAFGLKAINHCLFLRARRDYDQRS
jgi:hypothetical protein